MKDERKLSSTFFLVALLELDYLCQRNHKKLSIMTQIFRVITQTAAVSIQKQDGTQTQKCSLVLQELAGKYENSIVATMLGNMASLKFYQNDIVAASLRFSHREYNGQYYMDCTVRDIIKINTSNAF